MACTGQTWSQIGREWTLPRLQAWRRTMGSLPPLQLMIGRYLSYPMPEAAGTAKARETDEEAAARLLGAFMGRT